MEHYYETASKNHVTFSALDVYPSGENAAYRLAYPMWHYNFNSDTALLNRRLVELFAEATTLASADVNFANYDAVLIFHAGVGKDFNIGIDNTPFDIPSAYISPTDIQRYGVTVPANVTRGLLLPEGQNQTETLEFEIELSLNGVMIKLFGNWLGMPDLFNTETGASGIGRWGMMDQGSGNVNAVVPALPDAWSRVFMGWENAQTVLPTGIGDTVNIARFNISGAPEILKIPVLSNEYYLIENRDADFDSIGYVSVYDRDNREMRLYRDGSIATTEGFRIPVRASHYDYGIPGSGVLIWHIVEDIINSRYGSNRINADPDNRGVELVEADGSRDIGREYGFATAGSGTELGIPEDCWYRDNRDHRDANNGTIFVRFTDESRPSARLRDHSFTGLALDAFSDIDSIMSLRVRNVSLLQSYPVTFSDPEAIAVTADLDGDLRQELYVQSHDSLYVVIDTVGAEFFLQLPQGTVLDTAFKIAGTDREQLLFVGNPVGCVRTVNSQIDSAFRGVPLDNPHMNRVFVCETSATEPRLVFNESTRYAVYDENMALLGATSIETNTPILNTSTLALFPTHSLLARGEGLYMRLDVEDSLIVSWQISVPSEMHLRATIVEPQRTTFFLKDLMNLGAYYDAANGEMLCGVPECTYPDVDWDGDGVPDGGGANGVTRVDREDFVAPQGGAYWVHDLNFNGEPDLFFTEQVVDPSYHFAGWKISGYNHQTHLYPNYPMVVDGEPKLLRLNYDERRYHVLSTTRGDDYTRFSMTRLPTLANGSVEEIYQAPDNLIIIGEPRPQVHDRENFAYVWPNPSADIANIRLTLPYAANADVSIFDLAGRRVAQLSGSSNAAGPFEIEWNTRSVQSGVYIGRVEARGAGGTSTAELRIAVVR